MTGTTHAPTGPGPRLQPAGRLAAELLDGLTEHAEKAATVLERHGADSAQGQAVAGLLLSYSGTLSALAVAQEIAALRLTLEEK